MLPSALPSGLSDAPADAGEVAAAVAGLLRVMLPASVRLVPQVPTAPVRVRCPAATLVQMLVTLCLAANLDLQGRGGVILLSVEPDGAPGAPTVRISITPCVHATGSAPASGAAPEPERAVLLAQARALGRTVDASAMSTPEDGGALMLWLPLTGGEWVHPTVAPASPRARVMVVDDQPDITDVLAVGLQRRGYDVAAFTRSRQALAAFAEAPWAFDAVVTDYMMPELDGEELCVELKDRRPDIKVILYTALTRAFSGARQAPLDAVVEKPADAETLARAIDAALARSVAEIGPRPI